MYMFFFENFFIFIQNLRFQFDFEPIGSHILGEKVVEIEIFDKNDMIFDDNFWVNIHSMFTFYFGDFKNEVLR